MTSAREAIVDAFRAGLDAVQPDIAVKRALLRSDTGEMTEQCAALAQASRVEVIAIGKAAVAMMSGALDALGSRVQRGFVITKDGHVDLQFPAFIEIHEAAHPVLDERSVIATERLLQWVRKIGPDTPVLCLISGGGSALLEAPIEGISLEQFQTMTRLLLHAGADIHQLNAVRSQLSRVKGGRLREAIPAATVITLALSDVLGNDPAVIASGPTVPRRTTRRDAREIVARLELTEQMPESINRLLGMTEETHSVVHPGDIVAVIADNKRALLAASDRLRARGCRVNMDAHPRTGEARLVAVDWVRQLRAVPASTDAVVAGGELTVTVTGSGTGGRNTEFALAAALELERLGMREWTIASLATDGQDGATDVAGAIVTSATPQLLRAAGLDPAAALTANDSFPGLQRIGAVVATGPTGTNVNDLYFGVRTTAHKLLYSAGQTIEEN